MQCNHSNRNEARIHFICPFTVLPSSTPPIYPPPKHFPYLPKELFLFLHCPFSTFRNKHGSSSGHYCMLQRFHSWEYVQRIQNQHSIQVFAHPCSSLQHSQVPGIGSGLNVHQQVTTFQECVDMVIFYSTSKNEMTSLGIGGAIDHCV